MRNFHKDDFYFQDCILPLSYITLTVTLPKLSLLVCSVLNILQYSCLHLASVTFAFFPSNMQCVSQAYCIVSHDIFSCPATCRGLDFLVADSPCSISLCRDFFLLCATTGSFFSVFKTNFASVMKSQSIRGLYSVWLIPIF